MFARQFARVASRTAQRVASRSFASAASSASRGRVVKVTTAAAVFGTAVCVSTAALAESGQDSIAKPDYKGVRAAIVDIFDKDEDLGPFFVRLAWHSSGSYSQYDRTGGSQGACMRFKPEADYGGNAGLDKARALLEPVKAKFPLMSYADLYIYAANVCIEEMGGPAIPTKVGRTDDTPKSYRPTPDGRLPDAAQGAQHVRDVFARMGFNEREMVALIGGGHALGRCHTDRSGFEGPWTRAPTTFSNLYFTELMNNTWTVKKWDGPKQYEDPTGELMMLPSDMAFKTDPVFAKWCKVYADDEHLLRKDFTAAWRKLTENGVTWTPETHYA